MNLALNQNYKTHTENPQKMSNRTDIINALNGIVADRNKFEAEEWTEIYKECVILRSQTKPRKPVAFPEEIWNLIKGYLDFTFSGWCFNTRLYKNIHKHRTDENRDQHQRYTRIFQNTRKNISTGSGECWHPYDINNIKGREGWLTFATHSGYEEEGNRDWIEIYYFKREKGVLYCVVKDAKREAHAGNLNVERVGDKWFHRACEKWIIPPVPTSTERPTEILVDLESVWRLCCGLNLMRIDPTKPLYMYTTVVSKKSQYSIY